MKQLKRLLVVLGAILGFIFLPYLFGKMYAFLIFNRESIDEYWQVHSALGAWCCGLLCTILITVLIIILLKIYQYIRYGD